MTLRNEITGMKDTPTLYFIDVEKLPSKLALKTYTANNGMGNHFLCILVYTILNPF